MGAVGELLLHTPTSSHPSHPVRLDQNRGLVLGLFPARDAQDQLLLGLSWAGNTTHPPQPCLEPWQSKVN